MSELGEMTELEQIMQGSDLQPLWDRILVQPFDSDQMYGGKIWIPETAGEKPQWGLVIAAGPDCKAVEPGNVIMFGKYAGTEATGAEVIMAEKDAFGILIKGEGIKGPVTVPLQTEKQRHGVEEEQLPR